MKIFSINAPLILNLWKLVSILPSIDFPVWIGFKFKPEHICFAITFAASGSLFIEIAIEAIVFSSKSILVMNTNMPWIPNWRHSSDSFAESAVDDDKPFKRKNIEHHSSLIHYLVVFIVLTLFFRWQCHLTVFLLFVLSMTVSRT